jgi:hypothetical protein
MRVTWRPVKRALAQTAASRPLTQSPKRVEKFYLLGSARTGMAVLASHPHNITVRHRIFPATHFSTSSLKMHELPLKLFQLFNIYANSTKKRLRRGKFPAYNSSITDELASLTYETLSNPLRATDDGPRNPADCLRRR